jgi:DNA-binding protein HU-beta
MPGRGDKQELVRTVTRRVDRDAEAVDAIVTALLDEIYAVLRPGQSVSLRDFGSFYGRPEWASWVFCFNPAQRLRKLFGWASAYCGATASARMPGRWGRGNRTGDSAYPWEACTRMSRVG